ncbi:MAG: hypothetical protein JSR98_20055 [Proteobacteria bacterium]|nr:hypothetical protein [Pseudomonadota bacterium]
MLLAPPPGRKFRRTDTKTLVAADGDELDPNNLDIARALEDGDLVEVKPAKPAKAAAAPTPQE